jgi:hypothetical protein
MQNLSHEDRCHDAPQPAPAAEAAYRSLGPPDILTGERSQNLRLPDIVDAVELIDGEMAGVALQAFATDMRKRWLVERGIEIISEASRHLDAGLKQRHPQIP